MQPKPAHLSQRTTAIFLLSLLLLQSCYQGPIITPQLPKLESNQAGKAYIPSIATEIHEIEGLEAKELSWTETQGAAAVSEALPQNTQGLVLATQPGSSPTQELITVADKPLELLASLPSFSTSTGSHLQSPSIQSSTPIREEYLQVSRKTAAQIRTNFGHSLPSPINNTPVLPLNTQQTAKQKDSSTNFSKSNQAKLALARDQQLAQKQKRAAQNITKFGHNLSAKIDQADVLNTPLNWKSREGHILLELYEAQGVLRAKVADRVSSQLTYDLPVIVFTGISLGELANYSAIKLQHYLHIQMSKAPVLGQVIFSQGGLSGGMQSDKKGKAAQSEKEESSEQEKEEFYLTKALHKLEEKADKGDGIASYQLIKKLSSLGNLGDFEAKQVKFLPLSWQNKTAAELQKIVYPYYKNALSNLCQPISAQSIVTASEISAKKLRELKLKYHYYQLVAPTEASSKEHLEALNKELDKLSHQEMDEKVNLKRIYLSYLVKTAGQIVGGDKYFQLQLENEGLVKGLQAFQEKLDQSVALIEEKESAYKKLQKLQEESNTKLVQQEADFKKQLEAFQAKLDQSAKVIEEKESAYKKLQESNTKLVQQEADFKKQLQAFQAKLDQSAKVIEEKESAYKKLQEESKAKIVQQEADFKKQLQAFQVKLDQSAKVIEEKESAYKKPQEESKAKIVQQEENFKQLQELASKAEKLNEAIKVAPHGEAIVKALVSNSTEFKPNWNDFTETDMAVLINYPGFQKLTKINLGGKKISDSSLKILSPNLKGLTNLQQLYLYTNQIGDAGMQALAPDLKGLTNLQNLNLAYNQIGDAGMQALAPNLKGLTNLQSLYLQNNQIGAAGMQALAPNLERLTNLTILQLDNNQIGDAGMQALGQNLKELINLKGISLNNNQIGDSGMQALAPNLKGLTNLRGLSLNNNQIGDSGMQALAPNLKGLTNLRGLSLQNNQIGDAGMQALSPNLKGLTNLQSLSLSNNQIGPIGIEALAQNFKELTNLQSLSLADNQIGPIGMQALAPNLKELTNLKYLDLDHTQIGVAGMQALVPNLKELTNLKYLNFSNNQIGDADIKALAPNLKELTNLYSLNFSNNQIGDSGVKVLGQHLQGVKGKVIHLSKKNISIETQAWVKQQCPGIIWDFWG
jgi:Leucine-rich repeat (LRR) protein